MTVAKPSQSRKRKAGRPAISETTLYRVLKERRDVK